MWPFHKKDEFDFGSFKEAPLGDSPVQEHDDQDSADLFPKTHEDRTQMAQSLSNTQDSISEPRSSAPVMNIHGPTAPDSYGTHFGSSSDVPQHAASGAEENLAAASSLDHKIDMLTRQVEILTSRVDLLKAHIESMQNKFSTLEETLDRKPKDSMWS